MKAKSKIRQLDAEDRRALALWAADCAGHVLPHFETHYAEDGRPRKAIESARAWAHGEIKCGEARAAAVAAHAAARGATDHPAALAVARAAGHAAGTAHMSGHARHAAAYAVAAVTSGADHVAAEKDWQIGRLPDRLHSVVFPNSIESK